MPANNSMILSNIDFDSYKNSLKSFLSSQDRFKDYDFDGSNMNILLDVLSYNTYLNSFYTNMIGSEMFLDSAVLRDSAVSHAKELNYTPHSFTSAVAAVSLVITSSDLNKRSIAIPKGTTFTSRFGSNNYTFSTAENIVVTNQIITGNANIFTSNAISIYEGNYTTDNFTVIPGQNSRYVLSNPTVDISSLSVSVISDQGANTVGYSKAPSLFGLSSNSLVYFVQGAENNLYEIVFGDGVIGAIPKNNSVIVAQYRTCSGELPNGCSIFKTDGLIDGEANILVNTLSNAVFGSVSESIESIKYNAPRAFTTQERAVTTEDFENLLKANFPEINAVVAYGGEQLNPPQYGKVFVAVNLTNISNLPQSKIDEYYRFIKPRSIISIDPVFTNPEYVYVYVNSIVNYNINLTTLNTEDIKTIVTSAILNYSNSNLNNFNRTLRYSKFVQNIDNSAQSIISNETYIQAVKKVMPLIGVSQNFSVNFNFALNNNPNAIVDRNPQTNPIISSSEFIYNGQKCFIEDDGVGTLKIMSSSSSSSSKFIRNIGTVNYSNGSLIVNSLLIDSYIGNSIKFYAIPSGKDIISSQNTILKIVEDDLDILVNQIRE